MENNRRGNEKSTLKNTFDAEEVIRYIHSHKERRISGFDEAIRVQRGFQDAYGPIYRPII
ncbi:hypothetical protein COU56_03615 [Candidatus Pacearchaeota archaeon CG10_big_fil_rev_8_21_14_0_10_31_9]|nr:MAG: hypothetical protein AUJ62_00965 [Candidatus Pacearchaeota archaeon CG1_02_32_21]PIN93500.1 MAG: hypothetical protein COU56_03615 [Candidatus Pacearchaeota archaeon CG10_big_fil_rev_8_21_14_0_10_31_9]PIZ83321.1 MAG: hypothetical protein COX97_01335 [Candidatus Pacearchaeota archaeon CG_4_10_14_0_2_um_filter_05_32_18]